MGLVITTPVYCADYAEWGSTACGQVVAIVKPSSSPAALQAYIRIRKETIVSKAVRAKTDVDAGTAPGSGRNDISHNTILNERRAVQQDQTVN